jgi:hypothetical protein
VSQLGLDRGAGTLQSNEDFEAWEAFLAEYDHSSIVELGTGSGRFTRWLDEHCHVYATFDLAEPAMSTPGFRRCDILHGVTQTWVVDRLWLAPRPVVLFCDNGDKPREVKTFSPVLRSGDFLAVHDFGTEIQESDIPAHFEPLGGSGLTRFYRVP